VCRTGKSGDGTNGDGKDELDEKWDRQYRFVRFLARSVLSFSLCFSLASKIRSAVPLLYSKSCVRRRSQDKYHTYINRTANKGSKHQRKCTNLVLNSSGTSTDGFPSAFNLASTRGFSSCAVRDGRETYGREALHSYVKWPVNVLFDELE